MLPNPFKFSTAATQHGCKHEDQATETFENFMKNKHIGYKTIKCGMFINKQFPWLLQALIFYLGANAMGMVAEK